MLRRGANDRWSASVDLEKDAAERIAVEYEPLPSVTATEEALSPAAPKLWAECDNNECFFFALGDKLAVETAFAKAHHVTRIKLTFNRVTAATMEPRGCIAEWNDHLGRFTLYVGTQRPHTPTWPAVSSTSRKRSSASSPARSAAASA